MDVNMKQGLALIDRHKLMQTLVEWAVFEKSYSCVVWIVSSIDNFLSFLLVPNTVWRLSCIFRFLLKSFDRLCQSNNDCWRVVLAKMHSVFLFTACRSSTVTQITMWRRQQNRATTEVRQVWNVFEQWFLNGTCFNLFHALLLEFQLWKNLVSRIFQLASSVITKWFIELQENNLTSILCLE